MHASLARTAVVRQQHYPQATRPSLTPAKDAVIIIYTSVCYVSGTSSAVCKKQLRSYMNCYMASICGRL